MEIPNSALLYVIASPVAGLFTTGPKALSLEATSNYVRAWPGGMGALKAGGNYGPCFMPQVDAASRGFQQNLWLSGPRQVRCASTEYEHIGRAANHSCRLWLRSDL